MNTNMLERTAFLQCEPTLNRIFLRMDIQDYQKQQFAHVLLRSRSQKFSKIHQNAFAPESLFNLQPHNFIGSFAKCFRNTFIMENLLRTDFKRRILRKMVNRHSYYNREIFQKNRHCEGKCIFENIHFHW